MEEQLKTMPDTIDWTQGKVPGFAGKDLIKLDNGTLKLVKVEPHMDYPYHQHPDKTEYAYVLKGQPSFKIDDHEYQSVAGDFFIFPHKKMHSIHNHTDEICEMLVGAIKTS